MQEGQGHWRDGQTRGRERATGQRLGSSGREEIELEGEKEWKMNSRVDKHQGRKGESPCNFSNPPGIYTFTRQIMKMKNKMEKLPFLPALEAQDFFPLFFFSFS